MPGPLIVSPQVGHDETDRAYRGEASASDEPRRAQPTQRRPVSTIQVGVLALQGAFRAHEEALRALGIESRQVRTPAQLAEVDALVMPGGESTTMSKLLESPACSSRWPNGSATGCRCSAPARG